MFSIQFCICKINDCVLKFSLGCIVQNRMHPKKEQLLTPELLKEKILVGGVCLQKHSLSEVFHPSSIMQACTSTFHVATAKLLKPLRAKQSPRKCMIMKTTTFCQTLDHIIVPHMLTLACKAFFSDTMKLYNAKNAYPYFMLRCFQHADGRWLFCPPL